MNCRLAELGTATLPVVPFVLKAVPTFPATCVKPPVSEPLFVPHISAASVWPVHQLTIPPGGVRHVIGLIVVLTANVLLLTSLSGSFPVTVTLTDVGVVATTVFAVRRMAKLVLPPTGTSAALQTTLLPDGEHPADADPNVKFGSIGNVITTFEALTEPVLATVAT